MKNVEVGPSQERCHWAIMPSPEQVIEAQEGLDDS